MTIEVKRLYLPVKKSITCPHCGKEYLIDLSSDYISYPETDKMNDLSCYCWECETHFTVPYKLKIDIEFFEPEE